MKTFTIAAIPGDGVGSEVVPPAKRVLEKAANSHGVALSFQDFDWGSEHFFRWGRMMPAGALDLLMPCDAILMGAVGHPDVPDHTTLNGMLLPIRRAVQTSVFTRRGIERIVRFAFELAVKRGKKKRVTSVTKSNAQGYSMTLWDRTFLDVAADFPGVETESLLVDAAAMNFVRRPQSFDATILSAGMLLDHLQMPEAAHAVENAVAAVLAEGMVRTPDLGGASSTEEVAAAVLERLA